MRNTINKEFFKRTNLGRFIILKILQCLLLVLKTIILFGFPFLIIFVLAIVCGIFKINLNPNSTVSLATFGIASALYIALLGFIISLLFSKEHYFKKKELAIFGNVKFLGIYPIYLLIIFDSSYLFFAIYYLVISDFQGCFIQSLTILLYSIVLILFIVLFYIRSDKNRFKRYLKNTGVFKKYRGSFLMEQDLLFYLVHKKTYKRCLRLSILNKMNQFTLNDEIPKVVEENIKFEKSVYNENIQLLVFYLDNYSNYIQTDMDITFLTSFIKNINCNIVEKLVSIEQYHLVEQVFNSLLVFALSFFESPYYKRNDALFKCASEEKKNISEEKLTILMQYENVFLNNINDLLRSVLDAVSYFENIKTKNTFIINIQKNVLPAYKKINDKASSIKSKCVNK